MRDDLARIRAQLTIESLGDRERDELFDRVRLAPFDDVAERGSASRWRMPTRTLFVAVAVALLITGAAVAGGRDALDALLANDKPSPERIQAFQTPAAEPVSADEYTRLEAMVLVPPRGLPVGTYPDSVLVAKYELQPRSKARVIVDDPRVGRIVAAPTTDGATFCQVYSAPGGSTGSGGSCGGDFDRAGLIVGYGFSRNADGVQTFEMTGIAADDVQRIEVEFADGSVDDVLLIESAFRWRGSGEARRPVEIRTWRGGRAFSSDQNQFDKAHDPYTTDTTKPPLERQSPVKK